MPTIAEASSGLDPERWGDLYARFASLLSARGWLEPVAQARTRLDAALAAFPDITITRLARDGALLQPAIADRVPLDKLLTWLTTSGAVRRWQDIVDLATTKGTVLPPRLVEAALARPGFLESALQAEPSVVPLEPLLQQALVSRSIAAVVDRYVPPATRWPVLPWVRERYAGRPGQAAANELAVAFGLSYAGYLRHLASMVRPPYDPADRGRHFDHLYRTHTQPKRSGGTRENLRAGRGPCGDCSGPCSPLALTRSRSMPLRRASARASPSGTTPQRTWVSRWSSTSTSRPSSRAPATSSWCEPAGHSVTGALARGRPTGWLTSAPSRGVLAHRRAHQPGHRQPRPAPR